jgi:hypothetical protein
MAIRDDFAPGEVLTASDLNDTFGSKADYPSGGSDGQALIKSGTTTAWGAAGGRVLQVVRGTDSTQRSTTSTSWVDCGSLAVTITPQFNNSAVLLIATIHATTQSSTTGNHLGSYQITDNSNNAIAGAQELTFASVAYSFSGTVENRTPVVMIGYSTPATTSATTYKVRFASNAVTTTTFAVNGTATAQLYALEIAA